MKSINCVSSDSVFQYCEHLSFMRKESEGFYWLSVTFWFLPLYLSDGPLFRAFPLLGGFVSLLLCKLLVMLVC